MADDQRHARIFGLLFIVTFITSIGALALFQPVLDDPVGYIAGGGKDSQIYLGALPGAAARSSRTSERPSSSTRSRGVRTRPSRSATSPLESSNASSSRSGSSSCSESWACGTTFRARTTLPSRSPRSRTGRSCSAPAHRPLWERVDPRLLDVQVRARSAAHGLARNDRRADPLVRNVGVARSTGGTQSGAVPSLLVVPEIIWEAFLGIYCAIWGFRKDSPIVRPNWRGNTTAT